MNEILISVDSSDVEPGKLEELQAALGELVEFVDASEPRPIAYAVYFNEDGTKMTVVQVHPDSASMEFHMTIAGPVFAKVKGLLTLRTIDLYGKPSETLVRQMQGKAELLGIASVNVHPLHAGFARQ